ncbi:MAG: BatD family protein [Prevotellaceae bacterium]|nr:BatD family protein [Prevotellaceae bacterium]
MNVYKRILAFALTLFCSFSLNAGDLKVKTDNIVSVGQKFQIAYTIDYAENNPVTEFIRPAFSDFNLIAGPSESTSIVNINGATTLTKVFTYYVQAKSEGIFPVPEASVKLKDGTVVKSESKSIEVIKESQNSSKQSNLQAGEVSSEDLFVNMEFNRQSVYKGEPVILTIKLYSHNVPVTGISNFKMPTLAGFDTQELTSNNDETGQQKYNDRIYRTHVLGRLILYPSRAGDIKLDPVELVATVQVRQQQQRHDDMFEFFMGPAFKNINKSIKAAPVTLKVKDFPAGAPASFNGATGNFNMTLKTDKTSSLENQPITYSVTISGTGNFRQISEPLVVFPDRFDKYDPKLTDNVKSGASGGTGSKKFDYVIIPRNSGNFEIKPAEFTYFDTQKGTYVTLKTDPVHLEIEKDPNSSNTHGVISTPIISGKKVEHFGNDILFIKTDLSKLKPVGYVFFASANFYMLLIILTAAFAIACLLTKRLEKNRKNTAMMRNKKANKIAVSRLKLAAKLLKTGDATGFYEEVSKALWGYIGDKLNMQSSELSRDNIQEKLSLQNVPEENTALLMAVIDNCEYARYAPGGGRKGMEEIYNEAVKAITKLENLK